jgi:hypothetical protein
MVTTEQAILIFTILEATALVLMFSFGEDIYSRFLLSPISKSPETTSIILH